MEPVAADLEVTLVVETYTHAEGSTWGRLATTVRAADEMLAANGRGELVVLDFDRSGATAARLAEAFPRARALPVAGLGYDDAKMQAARTARGEYVVYLDGDCIPCAGWLDRHLDALRSGLPATGGLTRYDGHFFGALESVLDFGFLLPATDRPLMCYASNNAGFRRDVLLASPVPDGPMRCRCHAHAQRLARRGTPVRLVPGAEVRHERQPFFVERYRQGFDLVAACWVDPQLRHAPLLRLGPLAVPLLYGAKVGADWRRLARGRRTLELTRTETAAAVALAPLVRLLDLAGMTRALLPGGRERGAGFILADA